MAIKTLVVDDEDLARERILRLLNEDHEIDVIGTCRNGSEALEAVRTLEPELVFTDVQMPGTTGIDLVEKAPRSGLPVFVFVTAYDKYALKAFELHAVEYLLKPFDADRFRHALEWAKQQVRRIREISLSERVSRLIESRNGTGRYQERITVKTGDRIQIFRVEEIDWIDSAGNYASLHIRDKSYLIRITMNALEEMLDPSRFARIHRSSIVNLDRVKELRPAFHGEYTVILENGTRLKLSRNYRQNLLETFG